MSDDRAPDFVIQDAPRGRGRPRKDTPPKVDTPAPPKVKTQATTADVRQALKTLESGYNAIALGMTILGLSESATLWASQAETLSKSNEQTLTAAPKLAKAIARAGNGGGAGAFVLAHAMAIAPVVPVVRSELARSTLLAGLAERRQAAADAAQEAPAAPYPAPTPPAPFGGPQPAPSAAPDYDPTLIPGTRRAA